MSNTFKFVDNSKKVLDDFQGQLDKVLEECGQLAEGYAKAILTERPMSGQSWYTRTGRLRNSIAHVVDDNTAYVGSNLDYAPYVEYGTGPKAEGTTADGISIIGRHDVPWFFKDAEGNGHLSYGIEPSHMIKNSIADHAKEYKDRIESALKDN